MAKAQTKAITATRKATTTSAPKQPQAPSQNQIAERAYKIWQDTGGTPEDNWLTAETELNGKKTSTSRSRASRS
ncbi:MAG: DUF2934 domain-containing protein [Phycisphaerales bacterium]|nr:MAG: DUF2934 domain-containing protein [Phycisphaerales bacterium]